MTKTYTPLIIEGEIYVVVDAPEMPSPLDIHFERKKRIYYSRLFTCTKYETLPEHAPYWEERIGQRVEVEIGELFKYHDGNYQNKCSICKEMFVGDKRQPVCKSCCETTYAIPPQQNQGDDLWDEVMKDIVDYEQGKMMICDLLEGFKRNYNIKRKQ